MAVEVVPEAVASCVPLGVPLGQSGLSAEPLILL